MNGGYFWPIFTAVFVLWVLVVALFPGECERGQTEPPDPDHED